MFWPRRPLEAKHNAFFGASEQLSKVRVWPVSLAQAPARRTSSISGLLLPVEHNAAAVAEVALVLIAPGKVIAEPSQYKIHLRRPDRKVLVHANIETPANGEIEGIVARGMRGGGARTPRVHARMEQIVVSIRVGAAKQGFNKGLPTLTVVFENWPYVVGEQIAAPHNGATCWARAICSCREMKRLSGAAIAIKFTGDPQKVIEIKRDAAASSVQGKAANDVAILWIEPHIGVIHGNFNPGVVLSKRSGSEQQNNSQNNGTSESHILLRLRFVSSGVNLTSLPHIW